ncbi:MAG: hypothetical protein RLZZ628_277 [Bacteroidota bacterium]|jgi:hypothetical protein
MAKKNKNGDTLFFKICQGLNLTQNKLMHI